MNIDSIVTELTSERQRIDAALAALQGTSTPSLTSDSHRSTTAMPKSSRAKISSSMKAKWVSRKRSLAQKKRWAKVRETKAAEAAAKTAAAPQTAAA